MSVLMVTYVGDNSNSFDRNYYDNSHIPLVEKTWGPYGLQRTDVFYPVDAANGHDVIAVCLCHFPDRASLDRALAAPETAPVTGDVTKFTDIAPMLTIVAPSRS
jgi:uncharacterized protein (TIGR02118 family)